MDKYFLMGRDGIIAYQNSGAQGVANCEEDWAIVKYNERSSLLKDLLDKFIGWDDYLEIHYTEVEEIERQKNAIQWHKLRNYASMKNGSMTAEQYLVYLQTNFTIPVPLDFEAL